MPSALLLDPEQYLDPIPGANPAGRKLLPMELIKLKEFQEDFDPERDLSERDRQNPMYAEAQKKSPQWGAVIDFGSKFLKESGKDLQLVVRMVEALTRKPGGGFAGLRTGVRLIRRLCEDCWERMYPLLDPEAMEESIEDRAAAFNFLDDPEKVPYFPNSVRGVPVLRTDDGRVISFQACQQQGKRPAEITQDEFRQAVNAAPADDIARVKAMDEDITEALTELHDLSTVLESKVGRAATGFGYVRKALADCQTMTQQIIKMRSSGVVEQPSENGEGGPQDGEVVSTSLVENRVGPVAMMPGTPVGGGNPRMVREQIYDQFKTLADMLEDYDPHSPVPLLIRRVIELRELKFPQLVDTLTKDSRVLDFLRGPPAE